MQTTAQHGKCQSGFTLVEVLVVMGILAVLTSILLPMINATQRNARAARCAGNIRTIGTAFLAYAADNGGHLPPYSVVGYHEYWYDAERVGKYLKAAGAEVMKCPADPGARRSYAMNIWACSRVSAGGQIADWMQTHGSPWNMETTQGSRLMLIVESWSGIGSESSGWSATAVVGWQGETPGQRFGAGGGIDPPASAGRWGSVRSELPYSRHRISGSGSAIEPAGRVHIGYADGHVALKSESDLADFTTGRSTLGSLWSPLDPEYNR